MATDPNLANETTSAATAWGGFAPFVAAAFALNKANQAAAPQAIPHSGHMAVPGGGHKMPINFAPEITAQGVAGPLAMPSQLVNNGMPAALQAGVNGPMQGVSLPSTPQVNNLTAPVDHFTTGTPNPFGTQSFG